MSPSLGVQKALIDVLVFLAIVVALFVLVKISQYVCTSCEDQSEVEVEFAPPPPKKRPAEKAVQIV